MVELIAFLRQTTPCIFYVQDTRQTLVVNATS
jgi:hypothetical protein